MQHSSPSQHSLNTNRQQTLPSPSISVRMGPAPRGSSRLGRASWLARQLKCLWQGLQAELDTQPAPLWLLSLGPGASPRITWTCYRVSRPSCCLWRCWSPCCPSSPG